MELSKSAASQSHWRLRVGSVQCTVDILRGDAQPPRERRMTFTLWKEYRAVLLLTERVRGMDVMEGGTASARGRAKDSARDGDIHLAGEVHGKLQATVVREGYNEGQCAPPVLAEGQGMHFHLKGAGLDAAGNRERASLLLLSIGHVAGLILWDRSRGEHDTITFHVKAAYGGLAWQRNAQLGRHVTGRLFVAHGEGDLDHALPQVRSGKAIDGAGVDGDGV
mmetsp:Transcript_837/g.2307  ORF Transcript_837/g.2307 Transcript_837/m.2307 type:complete len:222 (+) Transcript_837:3710-4375(+)